MNYLLGERLHFDWKVVTITIVSTLLLMVDHYHRFAASKYWDRFILYLIIPLIIILLLFRENPKEYGFSLGDWKAGLLLTFIGILLMAPIIYYLGRGDASMQEYYKPFTVGLPWTTFIDLIGFRAFNNQFGQNAGDDVLRELATELATLSETCTGRDGGGMRPKYRSTSCAACRESKSPTSVSVAFEGT